MKDLNVNMNAGGKRQQMRLKVNNKVNANNLMKQRSGGSISRRAQTQNLGNITGDFKTQVSRLMGGSGKVKTLPLVAAIRQLSVMTNAGISIHDSIKEVARATEDKTLKGIFSAMNDDLNAGLSLTESAEKFRPQLGDVVVAMVSLGEATGNMAESLAKLASMLTELYENQRKFKKAMRYPMTLMIVMAIAFTILMMYVVPKFREIFEELGADLPLPTRILLGIESALSNYGGYILLGIIVTIVGLKWLYKNNDQFKIGWDRGILKVYLFGKIIFYSTMSRFMLIFTELVRAGIPIADALDTAVLMVDNHTLKEKLSSVKIAVQQGVSLTEAFENTGLYESMLIQMISAGEQAGNLDKMLGNVADYYKEKFDDIIDNISSYVEPIMLFFMAGMVLLLALGIFMPMWDLGKAVKS
ncbi:MULTISPECIES: type II secretion system F family protein [unclassified Campylobacter]|uniref:type II secretion system F family protein n=1 Tax=unclassified Campylobacter TaxID=2593542 RepID=UPI0022E9A635|nr:MULTISPECIES: type II secretion system F family protein [unclassified Campylobacter]MDA3054130.1 type II secretion system F family protein [Campylobacter sp. VBCF_07 NA4]MDA3059983.1 type II secretion system F family protein [Campylobacter sp. VBCF_02 NA5]MDA3062454.1 type II secretion system F family protein [Campylobacter sp. JMF_14 EL1]MDA3069497.1 type II secretion system F family protein [Campylobacter sp. VBCF_08 NA3]MDA3073427.1 type II secretion system F family protein [Campylobacte